MSGLSESSAPAPAPASSNSIEDEKEKLDEIEQGIASAALKKPLPPAEHGQVYMAARNVVNAVHEKCETTAGKFAQMAPPVAAVCATAETLHKLDKAYDHHLQGDKEAAVASLASAGKTVLSNVGSRYKTAAISAVEAVHASHVEKPAEGEGVSDHIKNAAVRAASAAIGGSRFSAVVEPALNAGSHLAQGKHDSALDSIRELGVKGIGAVAGKAAENIAGPVLRDITQVGAEVVAESRLPKRAKPDDPQIAVAAEAASQAPAMSNNSDSAIAASPAKPMPKLPSGGFMSSLTSTALEPPKRTPQYLLPSSHP